MNMKDAMTTAINESERLDMTVTAPVDDIEEATDVLTRRQQREGGALDYVDVDDGSRDIWGWRWGWPNDDQDWRLRLVLVGEPS